MLHLTLAAGRLFECVLFVIVFIVWLAIVSNDSVCIDSFTFGSFESFELISLSVLLVLASMLIYLLLFFWQRKWCLYSPVLVTHSIACIHPWQLSHKSSNEQTKNKISLINFRRSDRFVNLVFRWNCTFCLAQNAKKETSSESLQGFKVLSIEPWACWYTFLLKSAIQWADFEPFLSLKLYRQIISMNSFKSLGK